MAIDAQTEIKGEAYRLIKLSPIDAGRLATRVAQQLAGALDDVETIKSLVNAAKDGEGADESINPLAILNDQPQLLSALAGGIAKVNAEVLYDCALQCVKGNLFAKTKLHDEHAFNAWFSEHPDHLLLVLVWALKENCAGFFGLGGKG